VLSTGLVRPKKERVAKWEFAPKLGSGPWRWCWERKLRECCTGGLWLHGVFEGEVLWVILFCCVCSEKRAVFEQREDRSQELVRRVGSRCGGARSARCVLLVVCVLWVVCVLQVVCGQRQGRTVVPVASYPTVLTEANEALNRIDARGNFVDVVYTSTNRRSHQ